MKKLLVLVMSIGLLIACNNNKGPLKRDDKNTTNRDKDDYRDGDNTDKDDKNSKYTDDKQDDNSSGGDWSSSDVKKFVSSCLDKALEEGADRTIAEAYCNCMQRKVEKKFPDTKDLEDFDQNDPATKKWMTDCLEQSGGTANSRNDDDNSGGGEAWTQSQARKFVSDCAGEAEKGGMSTGDAQSYCDCMQNKIEKLYSYRDANNLTEADLSTPSMKKMIRSCLPAN